MESPDIPINLKFLKWQPLYEIEKPFQIFINIPDHVEDKRTTNLVFETVEIPALDVRTCQTKFDLDHHGFQYCYHNTAIEDFKKRDLVDKYYLPEMERLLKDKLEGVDRVFFFDWRLRRNAPEVEGTVIDLNDLTTWLRPAMHVHIDQSPAAVLNRVQLQLREDAASLLQGRIRVINLWRPLINSVEDWPLAICDGSSVDRKDLVEADHIRRHYMGSTMYLKHNAGQKFYFMSNQSKNDVLIFKNFDSSTDVRAQFAPHASFLHPSVGERFTPRESIEVRALVFTYAEAASRD